MMKSMTTTLTLSLITSAALYAAAPTTGDILRQVEQPKLPDAPKALPSVGAGEYKAPLSAKDDLKTYVKSFRFSGNSVFTSEILSELLKPYEGKELGINGLKEVASIITKYYRDHGYFVARAYIPAQSLENGIVEIAIIEGTYGGFDIQNTSLVETDEVQSFMDYLKQGQIVSTMSLERQMLLINDLSGAAVTKAEVYPGKEVGTSNFGISVGALPKYSAYAIADNYGSRYTGENRLLAGGSINSLTGIGDTLSLSGLISNTADLKNGRIAYDRPLGYAGFKGGVSFSSTSYKLQEELAYLDAFGRTDVLSAYLSYPTLKTRAHTQILEVNVDHRNMKDSSNGDEAHKSVDALTFKGTDKQGTSLLNLPGSLYTSAGLTLGRVSLKNDNAHTNDALLNSEGGFVKAAFNTIHSQYLMNDTTLQTTFKAQKSFGKNLDSSEDISVGGTNAVRAYEDSELSGDQGYAISMDFIYNLPQVDLITHNASFFIDHAKVWKNTDTFNTEDNDRILNAIGIGYGANYKDFSLKATFAHGFGGERTPTAEGAVSTSLNKFLVQGIMRF